MPDHPLATGHAEHAGIVPDPRDPLGPDELARAARIVRASPELSPNLRFISANLIEPALDAQPAREALIVVLDLEARAGFEARVDLASDRLLSFTRLPSLVQPGIALEEFVLCEEAVKQDPNWRAALARRGITEWEKAIVDPWSAGAYGDEKFPEARLAQALTWIRGSDDDVGYGRPVEGVIAWVDLVTMRVLEVVDDVAYPLPPLTGNYTATSVGPLRTDLKPLEIVQPEGPSFSVRGRQVEWQRWRFHVGFTSREGLVLRDIAYCDRGTWRPVLRRASLSEMQVPYGDPTPTHNKKNVFDVGEYGIGRMANTLSLGCDCLGVIHYFDAYVLTMKGEPEMLRNVICLHEEDDGVLWKHTDWRTNHTEVRRSRRLVVSFFATVGNYDYGFFWYFYQNGDIAVEVKLTGCLSVGALPPGVEPTHGALVAPQLYAPIHQHYFSFRLDPNLDGEGNSIFEIDTERDPEGPGNPYGSSYRAVTTPIRSEREGARDADPARGRSWFIAVPNRRNAVGRPPGYKLMPGADTAHPFAYPGSSLLTRAGFIRHTLWVTRYDPDEKYAAGDYINQNAMPDGVASWVQKDRPLEAASLVLWYTLGVHHIPRPEDWPVMPVAHAGFMLRPAGFFDANPAMDLPPPVLRHSCCVS
ncbi:MAG TPA: primary-amine oxidase [Acetobacteraceae bacterium]|jgi:primary-amine oxidase|nr:primary-amine oxidase [Acetobacteraceae bacterium]